MKPTPAIAFVIAFVLVGGCGSTAESAVPPTNAPILAVAQPGVDPAILGQACQFGAVVFDVGPIALCAKAVALAIARLGGPHWPITSISFQVSLCPPNARCRAVPDEPVEGWVIFTFADGSAAMIHVGPAQIIGAPPNTLVAGAPEPVPQWLLDQMAGRLG